MNSSSLFERRLRRTRIEDGVLIVPDDAISLITLDRTLLLVG